MSGYIDCERVGDATDKYISALKDENSRLRAKLTDCLLQHGFPLHVVEKQIKAIVDSEVLNISGQESDISQSIEGS